MKYIVYLTVCTENNKIYVGVHKTENPDIFDGYLGCGVYTSNPTSYKKSKTPFQYAVNKYGVDKFRRITLKIFDTAEDAFALEKTIVTKDFVERKDTYNIKLGGSGGCPATNVIKVYAYSLDGSFVKEFESAFECAKFFNPASKNGSCILKAIRLGQLVYNHQFSKEKLPYMKKYVARVGSHACKIRIGRYDDNGVLLEEYESILSCIKAGYRNVNKALRLGIRCKGFYFKRIN